MTATVPTNVVDRIPFVLATRDRLVAEIPTAGPPPTHGYLSEPVGVPADADGRIERYWVLHPYAGAPSVEADVADAGIDLTTGLQVTVAAARPLDVLDLATRVDAALFRWAPDLLGVGLLAGPLRPPPGFDPGPVRVDEDFKPHRYWLPLQYQLTITTTA
jgi:hypothetical protein